MLTALIILGMIAVTCLIAGIVLVAVKLSEALQKQAEILDRAHERWVTHTESLHDRLMAKDWQEYADIKSFSEEDDGGFFTPDEQDEENDDLLPAKPTRWGSLRVSAEEERLLMEDFTDAGDPRRAGE